LPKTKKKAAAAPGVAQVAALAHQLATKELAGKGVDRDPQLLDALTQVASQLKTARPNSPEIQQLVGLVEQITGAGIPKGSGTENV
jgi:hypothetical protein